jgi:hypothetical protein
MFWFNMGPRARRAARRGFHPGMMIPLFLFLFFGGWSIIAVMGVLLSAGFITAGAFFSVFASFIGGIFSHVFSSASIAVGVAIGLAWYFYNKKRNAAEEEKEEEAFSKAEPETEEIIETTHYMFH